MEGELSDILDNFEDPEAGAGLVFPRISGETHMAGAERVQSGLQEMLSERQRECGEAIWQDLEGCYQDSGLYLNEQFASKARWIYCLKEASDFSHLEDIPYLKYSGA